MLQFLLNTITNRFYINVNIFILLISKRNRLSPSLLNYPIKKLIQHLLVFRENREASHEDAVRVGYEYAVVGYRHILAFSALVPCLHHPLGEHAASAVDDKRVLREIIGEALA